MLVVDEVLTVAYTGAKGKVIRELEEKRDREGVLMKRALIRIFLPGGHHRIGDAVIWKSPVERKEK